MHQRPLGHGADLVFHSATKGISGHGDTIGGVLAGRQELIDKARDEAVRMEGAMMSPFVAMLVARGARTLFVRMERASATAATLAERLSRDPRIARVHYPGLPSHPQHALAKRQMNGFGGMVSLDLKADLAGTRRFLEAVRIFALAESLGGVESLIEHPAIMTHATIPAETRASLGIGDSLVRLSVGIEDVEDLRADLRQALGRI